MESQVESTARGVVESVSDRTLVLSIPGTNYRLHLEADAAGRDLTDLVGRRITGRIEARALRVHKARGGGRFIEPIDGHPRIVQGTVESIDPAQRRVLVDVAVPMWVTLLDNQSPEQLAPGDLVNFYVKSGATLTPSE